MFVARVAGILGCPGAGWIDDQNVSVVAFSIWMDTHKSRSVPIHQGFFMLQSSHWHGPCTRYDTQPFGWLKKRRPLAALGFSPGWGLAGYEPKCYGAWVNSAVVRGHGPSKAAAARDG